MNSRLVVYPERTLVVPPQYFGTAGFYAALARYGRVVIDDTMRHDRRFKSAHRMEIVDTHGRLQLTVPVGRPSFPPDAPHRTVTWHDIPISDHGRWWHSMRVSLESAYGRTPFFEFYIDRLAPMFDASTMERFPSVAALDLAADAAVRTILGLDNEVVAASAIPTGISADWERYSPITHTFDIQPHYQVRADRFGFVGNLSILDLIFNLGPEAPLILASATHNQVKRPL